MYCQPDPVVQACNLNISTLWKAEAGGLQFQAQFRDADTACSGGSLTPSMTEKSKERKQWDEEYFQNR